MIEVEMSGTKSRPWLFILLLFIAALLTFVGASRLYQNSVDILGYLLLGLGLGGFIAGWGELLSHFKSK